MQNNIFKMKMNQKYGMTLIEVLIVVSILTMLGVVLYNSLSLGLKVWKKTQQVNTVEDLTIFFDKFTQDIHNILSHEKLILDGAEGRFIFPTIVRVSMGNDEEDIVDQIGQVEYSFDLLRHAIIRKQASYGQAQRHEFSSDRVLVSGVSQFHLKYIYITDKGERITDVPIDGIPSFIEVEVVFSDALGKRSINKTVTVPAGN
jgi:prepilin-type N-terminal cleavage/methylation domain-containing protein